MTHQVPECYHSVSELLSNILDNVGYSREDRDRKVRIATETEVFLNIGTSLGKSRIRWYMFGSRGEGSTGPGLHSDTDFLCQLERCKVVTDLTNCHPDKTNYLMVKDNLTHPGYIKLQSIYISPDNTPVPRYLMACICNTVTIDVLNRSVLSNNVIARHGHVSGPALRDLVAVKEMSIDTVPAVRCSQWPQEGYEWFERRRLFAWPTPRKIEDAREYGCFATSVGHPHSYERDIEWRLSFSIAERDLTTPFEDTVMKVYILLKMLKKTYIQLIVGDAFSSYHCKVCMLWMRERTPRELWSNENLLCCLILCIRQLYEWATTWFCPDYFIVTNNIYDRKIIGEKQSDLVQILRYLLSTDCRFLLEIECCYLGLHLANGISGFDLDHRSIMALILQEEAVDHKIISNSANYCRHYILEPIPQCYPTLVDYLEKIVYASKHFLYFMQYPLKHVMIVLLSQLGFHISTVCIENVRILSREKVHYLITLASGCLSRGINIEATSVRLKLCGLGMELGNYDLTEVCLQHISDYRMGYVYSDSVGSMTVLDCNIRSCVGKLFTKRYSTEELMQTQMSFSVVYLPSEISITQTPIRMEMFRSIGTPPELRIEDAHFWYDWGVVDSLMCLYFFQYLNFSRQGKERHKQDAMDNMINVIRTKPKILHRDTALNLPGYSFTQENQLTNAFICFSKSLKIRPYHNAAKFYLGLLFKRVHVTYRMHVHYRNMRTEVAN